MTSWRCTPWPLGSSRTTLSQRFGLNPTTMAPPKIAAAPITLSNTNPAYAQRPGPDATSPRRRSPRGASTRLPPPRPALLRGSSAEQLETSRCVAPSRYTPSPTRLKYARSVPDAQTMSGDLRDSVFPGGDERGPAADPCVLRAGSWDLFEQQDFTALSCLGHPDGDFVGPDDVGNETRLRPHVGRGLGREHERGVLAKYRVSRES